MTEMVSTLINGQWELLLPAHRAARPDWYTPQGWEKPRLTAMHDVITSQPDPVVYYIGAELGEMPALCQLWGATVVLFEPNPLAWPSIRAIWEANDLQPPRCFAGFASSITDLNPPNGEPRREGIGIWPDSAYAPLVEAHGFRELYQEADAFPQSRVDDLDVTFYRPPTVIAFDIEGSEWQAMRGAEQTLRTHKPILFASIHPEFMFHQWGEYSRDFRNWLIALGYEETLLDYEHELHAVYTPA